MRTQKYYRHKKKQTRKKRRHKKTRQRGGAAVATKYELPHHAHRLTRPIKTLERPIETLERKDLKEVVDSFTSLIGKTLYTQESKGFIPEIKPYPLETTSDEVLARMVFEDEAVEPVSGVADLGDFRGPPKRKSSIEETTEKGRQFIGVDPLEKTRAGTKKAEEAAKVSSGVFTGIATGPSKQGPESDVFSLASGLNPND